MIQISEGKEKKSKDKKFGYFLNFKVNQGRWSAITNKYGAPKRTFRIAFYLCNRNKA